MGRIIGIGGEALVGKDTFAKPLIERGYIHGSFAGNLKLMCQAAFRLSPFHTDTQQGKLKVLNPPIPLTNRNLNIIVEWVKRTHDVREFAPKITEVRREFVELQLRRHNRPIYFNTPREILQFVGTEICRRLSPDYHAQVLAFNIASRPGSNWVITDARFPNERDMLKQMFNATMVRIKRPGKTPSHLMGSEDNSDSTKNEGFQGHASETSLGLDSEYDVTIINDGTVEDLQKQAVKLIE